MNPSSLTHRLIAQQQRVDALCPDCGRIAQIDALDGTGSLCGRCWMARQVASYQQYLARCQELLRTAETRAARRDAQQWVDNAERQLARWQAALDRVRAI